MLITLPLLIIWKIIDDTQGKTYLRRFFYLVNALGHMSFISHSGYGYSKKLCEDVASWFLNKYYPRHKIDVDIVHRGLKCDGVYGYCDVNGVYTKRPRAFLIDLQANMQREMYTRILLHELTHLAQWVDGSLQWNDEKLYYCKEPVEKYDYKDQPHEIEARHNETVLYDLYMTEMCGVPAVKLVRESFPNRLCAL